jgi:hypothetical protein
VAEGVVPLAFALVTEHLVGFVDLLEAGLGLRIIGVSVGVVLQRQLAIGALELLRTGTLAHAEDFVVVPLDRHATNLTREAALP